MAFYQFYAKLAAQFAEYATYLFTQTSKYHLFAILRDEHNVIQTIPSRMGLFVPFVHRLVLDLHSMGCQGMSLFFVTYQPRNG